MRTTTHIRISSLIVVGTLSLGVVQPSMADWYVPVSVGRTNYPRPVNGVWYQNGYDNNVQERSTTETLGIGRTFGKYVSAELDFRDFGDNRIYAAWESDESYNAWHLGKDPTVYGQTKDHLSGWVGSVLIGYPFHQVKPYARLGLMAYRWTHSIMWSDPYSPHSLSTLSYTCTTRGVTPVVGLGVQYRRFSIEYTTYEPYTGDNYHLCTANFSHPSSVTVGYRF